MAYIVDHIGAFSSFILIVKSPFNLPHKIKSTFLQLHYPQLTESELIDRFTTNFKSSYTTAEFKLVSPAIYTIYKNNNYNVGNTLAQIKYIKAAGHLTSVYMKVKDNTESLMQTIANNFIKKYVVLSNLERLLDLRKFIYTLLSLNLSTLDFVSLICTKMVKSKISNDSKLAILEKACYYSQVYTRANKLVIPLEALLFDIIKIIYCC